MARPEKEAGPADLFDPFGHWKTLRDDGMSAWSKMMLDFVQSDAYARASAQWLDAYLSMSQPLQEAVDQAMTRTLSQCKIPSTADVLRIADRLTNLEFRLDDLDARLDEIVSLLKGLAGAPTERAADRPCGDAGPVPQANGHAEPVPGADTAPPDGVVAPGAAQAGPANGSGISSAGTAAEGIEPASGTALDGATQTEGLGHAEGSINRTNGLSVEASAEAASPAGRTPVVIGTSAGETEGGDGGRTTESPTAEPGEANPSASAEAAPKSRPRRHSARPAGRSESDASQPQEET